VTFYSTAGSDAVDLTTAREHAEMMAYYRLNEENRALLRENADLRGELELANDQLEKQLADLEELRAENDRLRAPLTDPSGSAALIVGRDGYGQDTIWAALTDGTPPVLPVLQRSAVSGHWWPLIVERLCGPQT
jgi:hypothetical protein